MIRLENIVKRFPGVIALNNVNLHVGEGEIHALLGENGAGKSTLLKILSGAQPADEGTVYVNSKETHFHTPHDAQDAGIATIYQEFTLFPALSVADNIFAGRELRRGMFVDHSAMQKEAKRIIGELGLAIDPRSIVADLSVGEQQLVEIARALSMDAQLIIMDEPTAALSSREIERLIRIMRDLKSNDVSIIMVTHRLNEVFEVCDSYTVLRDGTFIESGRIDEVDEEHIIRTMVGRSMASLFERRDPSVPGDITLQVKHLSSTQSMAAASVHLSDISLEVRSGEIVGLAGLVGAGRTDFARILFGEDLGVSGEIVINGKPVDLSSPEDAIRHGIALVPEDRKQQGLFLDLACKDNVAISNLSRISHNGIINDEKERTLVEQYVREMSVKLADIRQPISSLSGGNQQKLLLARWMATNPNILIVDEPTRGVDIGAKVEVHRLLFELATQGVAVIVISSELPEVMSVSDRIYTFCEGHLTGELSADEANEEALMRLMSPAILTELAS
jgi:inositol transport system ATP-binding protein